MPDIDFQRIVLNLIPKKEDEPVVFYASQYETARPFIADLMWGDSEFAPGDSCWAEIDIRKVDDNLVVITDDVTIDNNEVSVVLPVQALTCVGDNFGQIKIYADVDNLVAALNFILRVQPDPLAGGVTSESAIDNLTTQIEEIAQAEGYLKSDDVAPVALSGSYNDLTDKPTIPDMTNYYTKSETYNKTQVDNALALKANTADLATVATTGDYDDLINKPDLSNYYTKSETDTLLSAKANSSDVYTKLQVDNIVDAMLPIATSSGNPCTFDTEIAGPIKELIVDIVLSGGNGTLSTPIPIVGHSALNLDVNGDTFTVSFGQTVYGGVYDKSGRLTITHGYVDLGDLTYSLLSNTSTRQAWSTSGLVGLIKPPASGDVTYNATSSEFSAVSYNATWLPSTFSSLTATSDQVVFCVDPNAYVDGNAMKASMSGIQFAYELTTPIEIDISTISASVVSGSNSITSDCVGDVTVSYKDSIQHYIDERT